jgi:hypothetical protein
LIGLVFGVVALARGQDILQPNVKEDVENILAKYGRNVPPPVNIDLDDPS